MYLYFLPKYHLIDKDQASFLSSAAVQLNAIQPGSPGDMSFVFQGI